MVAALQEKISAAAEYLEDKVKDKVCQEVMHHSIYCKKKANTFKVSIAPLPLPLFLSFFPFLPSFLLSPPLPPPPLSLFNQVSL